MAADLAKLRYRSREYPTLSAIRPWPQGPDARRPADRHGQRRVSRLTWGFAMGSQLLAHTKSSLRGGLRRFGLWLDTERA